MKKEGSINWINVRDLWAGEWKLSYNFFNSKGNIKTKSRLKLKWYKGFVKLLEEANGNKIVR